MMIKKIINYNLLSTCLSNNSFKSAMFLYTIVLKELILKNYSRGIPHLYKHISYNRLIIIYFYRLGTPFAF